MYIPAAFAEESLPVLLSLIERSQTGNLVTYSSQNGLFATNIPWLVETDPNPGADASASASSSASDVREPHPEPQRPKIRLLGHIARANPHWKHFLDESESAAPAHPSMVIFQTDASAYVSPGWYPSKKEHGRHVPTWNYEAVHAYGRIELIHDRTFLLSLVSRLTSHHEHRRNLSWSVTDAPESYIATMLKAIVGVVVHVDRIEGKRKMSQNREGRDVRGVVEALEAEGGREQEQGGGERETARVMREVNADKLV
ncbi:hypothetical protein M427DRAFT_125903 [Gonapodya prolifera JEL478]|uniref:Negative transcriptional regulator n=1 Tax=Gonapodya prolifera (strain JEL478) TaxID=1344416 RepID=A0A139A6S2_GONPJ|nr:hypothetical protein M427DRAFT_125903 [Gonapodya prolifera JEL478]|eukprot:KXS12359.1 hypothetical protein M427DRAFT_125903 [Gonapodya prolifera JEL478]